MGKHAYRCEDIQEMSPRDKLKIGSLVKVNDLMDTSKRSGYPDCIGTIMGIWGLGDRQGRQYAMVMWSNGTKSSISVEYLDIVMET